MGIFSVIKSPETHPSDDLTFAWRLSLRFDMQVSLQRCLPRGAYLPPRALPEPLPLRCSFFHQAFVALHLRCSMFETRLPLEGVQTADGQEWLAVISG